LRSIALAVLLFGGLAAFSLLTAGPDVPPEWRREWPHTDFSRHTVPLREVVSGGPPRDGIPPIDEPRFEPVGHPSAPLAPTEPVMSVEIGGEARAYPLAILVWHEVVNDTVGGVPLAVTYCPLCNSGIVYRRTVAGEATSFGTTGKLLKSNLVMYDRTTESWWQQYDGAAIVGARAGMRLEALPARLESLREFRTRHPDGLVLVPSEPGLRAYGRNPYIGYDSAAMPFLYEGDYDGPGSPLMRAVAVEGRAEAWSLDFLRAVGRVEAGDLVISWRPGQSSALDAPDIAEGRDVGTVTVQRRLPGGGLADVVYHVPFAFAFRAFNPDAPIRHVGR
jgi:hypothetical protein